MDRDELRRRLSEPLPGVHAQMKMAPLGRRIEIPQQIEYRKSAVLVPILESPEGARLVLTRRAVYPGVHSGQISFPGGKFEPGEVDAAEVALRESFEEIGLFPEHVEVLGTLSELFIPVSRMLVYPVLGIIKAPVSWVIDEREVDEILEIPIEHFFDTRQIITYEVNRAELSFSAPAYAMNPVPIWGATAMMISELVEVLKSVR